MEALFNVSIASLFIGLIGIIVTIRIVSLQCERKTFGLELGNNIYGEITGPDIPKDAVEICVNKVKAGNLNLTADGYNFIILFTIIVCFAPMLYILLFIYFKIDSKVRSNVCR